jgi:glutamine amidotransferase
VTQSVVIVDYDSGNLHSALKAVERAARDGGHDARVKLTRRPNEVVSADRVILPGVGAFADCRAGLEAVDGMIEAIDEFARHTARPFLGICVGMQLMARRGLEYGETPGLGWFEGDVALIETGEENLKVPHMGWNTLEVHRPHALLDGIETGPGGWHAYFVHSYHMVLANPGDLVATSRHGQALTAMIGRDNIAGTQFHPEKSQKLGLKLLANFLAWAP